MPRRIARAPAVACTGNRAVLAACDGRIVLLVDSRTAMWSVYELSSVRTPLSLVAGAVGGLPSGARTRRPLRTPPPQVSELSQLLGVDLAATPWASAARIWAETQRCVGSRSSIPVCGSCFEAAAPA